MQGWRTPYCIMLYLCYGAEVRKITREQDVGRDEMLTMRMFVSKRYVTERITCQTLENNDINSLKEGSGRGTSCKRVESIIVRIMDCWVVGSCFRSAFSTSR
jgi:hypothetical protein